MTSMRAAIMSNPTLAETVRQHAEQRRQATALQAELRNPRRIKAQRDAAITALIKARKSKKRSRPLLDQVLDCVAKLRMARELKVA